MVRGEITKIIKGADLKRKQEHLRGIISVHSIFAKYERIKNTEEY